MSKSKKITTNDIWEEEPSITSLLRGLWKDTPVCLRFQCEEKMVGGEENTTEERIRVALNRAGIRAVSKDDPDARLLDTTIVSGLNVETPLMDQASVKRFGKHLVDILGQAGMQIRGYVYPLTVDQLLSPGVAYGGLEVTDRQRYNEIIEIRGKNFISEMLAEAKKNAVLITDIETEGRLYRGGSLGNKPFAVVTDAYSKSACYATRSLDDAAGFAHKREWRFVYEYEIAPDQKFAGDYGYEQRKAQRNLSGFETVVFPHKNKLLNVYWVTHREGGNLTRLFRIPLEDKRWQDFWELHVPTEELPPLIAKRRRFQKRWAFHERYDKLVVHYDFIQGAIVPEPPVYTIGDLVSFFAGRATRKPDGRIVIDGDVDLRGIRVQGLEHLDVTGHLKLSDVGHPLPNAGILDLRACRNVDLTGQDLRVFRSVCLPEDIKSLKGIAGLPKKVDLSAYYGLDLTDTDFSTCEDVKLPKNIKSLRGIKWPQRVSFFDCYQSEFDGVDFSACERVTFPQNQIEIKDVKLPENGKSDFRRCGGVKFSNNTQFPTNLQNVMWPIDIDFSECPKFDFVNFKFAKKHHIKFPPNITCLDEIKLTHSVDLSCCDKLKLKGNEFFKCQKVILPKISVDLGQFVLAKRVDIDFRNCTSVKFPNGVFSTQRHFVLPTNGVADLSACEEDQKGFPASVTFPEDASKVIWPRNVVLTYVQHKKWANADFSACDHVAFSKGKDGTIEFQNVKFPKDGTIDFSRCTDLVFVEGVQFPRDLSKITWPPKGVVDFRGCPDLDFSQIDFGQFKQVHLPASALSCLTVAQKAAYEANGVTFEFDLKGVPQQLCALIHKVQEMSGRTGATFLNMVNVSASNGQAGRKTNQATDVRTMLTLKQQAQER